jgi:hypothetical protein
MSGATIKIKRRAAVNAAGAPASLKSAELAFNENATDKNLYYGYGDDGSGNATSVIAIAGEGSFATLNTNQTITGNKVFSGTVTLTGATVSLNSDQLTEGATNKFLTASGVRTQLSSGSNINYDSSTGAIALAETVAIASGLTTGGNVTVGGNLVVSGTTTTVNSTTVSIADKNLELGTTASPADAGADGGGITLKGTTDKTIVWLDATDSWTFNQAINGLLGLKINGTEIVSSGRVLSNVTLSGIVIDGGEF